MVRAHVSDPIAVNGDVTGVGSPAGAVVDGAVAQYEIVRCLTSRCGGRHRRKRGGESKSDEDERASAARLDHGILPFYRIAARRDACFSFPPNPPACLQQ